MSSPWTGFSLSKGTPRGHDSFSTRQSLNYSSFLDTSVSTPGGRSQNRSVVGGQVLEDTPNHRVETYGLTLPVQIREALATRDRQAAQFATVQIKEKGWAWLVCGRKLFIWRYLSTSGAKSLYCKELSLPPTDLKHSANLVALLPSALGGDSTSAASIGIIAASPEGVVRYWPNLAHDSNVIEITTDLGGRQCHSLTAFPPSGCILSTTTNDMIFLTPSQKTIAVHTLSTSGGVLLNLGRRMTSLFFGGAQPASDQSANVQKVLVGNAMSSNSRLFYVLNGNQLFKWEMQMSSSTSVQEKLLYQCGCESMFIAAAEQSLQTPVETVDQMRVWCLDICNIGSDVIILAAVALKGPSRTSLFYLLGTLDGAAAEAPAAFSSVNVVQFVEEYNASYEDDLLDYKLLLPDNSPVVFVYSHQILILVPVYHTDDIVNKVDFKGPLDGIIGAGAVEDKALFFSRRHGILNVIPAEEEISVLPDISRAKALDMSQRTLPDVSVSEEFKSGDPNQGQLKTAFLLYCQQNINEAQNLCDKLFLTDESGLDRAVCLLSTELIDDYPASDPRWAESKPTGGISISASLIILHQLEDKLKAHGFLVQFLKGIGLWDRLKTLTIRDKPLPTWCLLCEHAENIIAAIALCKRQESHQEMIDAVIKKVVSKRGAKAPYKALTDQDIFFREVSRIPHVFESLLEYEEEALNIPTSKGAHSDIIVGVNTILEEMLQSAWQYRQEKSADYEVSSAGSHSNVELMFWTGTTGPSGVRSILLNQLKITERGANNTDDHQVRSVLYQQMVTLSDILLDGYVCQLKSLRHCPDKRDRYDEVKQKYAQDRYNVILPLAKFGQYKHATSLAEKYQDFGVLIELCETRDDQESLQNYSIQFKEQGFSDYLFKWYMDKGERHKLMSQPVPQHDDLAKFLSSHHHLSWLHDIHTKSFYKAHETLRNLADRENMFLARKKTLLSLSKLALLACEGQERRPQADTDREINAINNEHNVILHQETLPIEVFQNATLDVDTMPPLTHRQLIELYVGDKNPNSTEQDFMKALDLLQLSCGLDSEEGEVLKRYIWCRAILKDNWHSLRGPDPVHIARHTIFFKTVEMAYSQGLRLTEFMPAMESLLESEELRNAGLLDDNQFRYLLSTGYEQIQRKLLDESQVME